MYFLVINRIKDPAANAGKLNDVIGPHIEWIREQISSGTLLQAGKWGQIGGMTVLKAGSLEAAESVLGTDPLVRSGLVSCEIAEFHPAVDME